MSTKELLRRNIPRRLWAIRLRLRRDSRQNRRRVKDCLEPISRGALKVGARGGIAGVSIVKNEADIVESTVMHLLTQGVDFVIIADHMSTDKTAEVLNSLSLDNAVGVFRVGTDGFYQEETIMVLAAIARKNGARWILPFDADEYWFAEHDSLAEFLQRQAASRVYAAGSNVFPISSDQAVNIWTSSELDLGTSNYRKVVFRSTPLAYVRHGNHDVVRHGKAAEGLRIAHAPIRSFEQLQRKVRQGAQGMRSAGTYSRGRHWHALDQLSDDDLAAYWAAVGDRSRWEELGWAPVGPFVKVQIAGAPNWRSLVERS